MWSRSLRVWAPAFLLRICACVLPCLQVRSPGYKVCTHFTENIDPHRRLYDMATPAMNFVAVCANANLPLPTSKQRQQAFLKDSGAVTPAPASGAKVKNELLPSSGCATRSRTTSLPTPSLRFWHPRSSLTCAPSTPSHPPRPAPILWRPIYIVSRACSLSSCQMVPRRYRSAPTSDCARYAWSTSFP